MAANKFASMLHKNCHKITVVLVYAVLEWILILLLLLNSFLSYLIAKFAKFFGLKPSCTWCSRLDHVFNSKNPHFDHVCEAHGTEISKMSFCSTHNKLAESHNLCIHCSSSTLANYGTMSDVSSTVAFFTWMSENASSQGGEEARCSCCDQILTTKVYPQSLIFKPTWDFLLEYIHKRKLELEANIVKKETEFQENGDEQQFGGGKKSEIVEDSNVEVQEWNSSQTADDPFWSLGCNEDEESVYIADMLLQNAELMDSDRFICIELLDTDAIAVAAAIEMPLTDSSEDFEEQVPETAALEDDNCAEALGETEPFDEDSIKIGHESSNREEVEETQCTITEQLRSEEVGVSTIDALYAELEEEREAAAEAAKETMAMITKLQEEKAAMQMEAVQYQRMMEEQAEYDQEALQLLNDLILKRDKENKQLHKELQIYRARENTTSTKGSLTPTSSNASSNNTQSAHLHRHDDYDDTRHHNSDREMQETGLECVPDISLAEFDVERVSILEEVKVLEAKLFANDDPMAKKLLPLFDGAENEFPDQDYEKEEIGNQSAAMSEILIQEELGHVYGRLQALEADNDFLKHCIRSINKGNQGMPLLQEILQHLRDLKSVELAATNLGTDIPLSDASMIKQDHQQFSSA